MRTFSKLFLALALLSGQALMASQARAQVAEKSEQDEKKEEKAETLNLEDIIQGRLLMAHRGGNGGNSIASEFATIGSNAMNAWKALCQEMRIDICDDLRSYESQFEKSHQNFVTVISAPQVFANDDEEREAVNLVRRDGKPYIVVSEAKWQDISNDYYMKYHRKINLVLHEYFSLIGLESSDYYANSRALFSYLESEDYDLKRIANSNQLPSACSVAVTHDGSVGDSRVRDIQSMLGQQGYQVEETKEKSRYNLNVSQECSGFLTKTCAIYVEMQDTYKRNLQVAYSEHTIEKGFGKKASLNSAYSKAFSNLQKCE